MSLVSGSSAAGSPFMVAITVRVCSAPTVPVSTASRNSGNNGGASPPEGRSLGRIARAAFTRPRASAAEIRNRSRNSTMVDAPCATLRVSSSPARWTCAAYTNRPTRSNVSARISSSLSPIFQNALRRNSSTPTDTDPATAVACSMSLIGSMNRTLDHDTDSPPKTDKSGGYGRRRRHQSRPSNGMEIAPDRQLTAV